MRLLGVNPAVDLLRLVDLAVNFVFINRVNLPPKELSSMNLVTLLVVHPVKSILTLDFVSDLSVDLDLVVQG